MIAASVSWYRPSPKCIYRTIPSLSTKYIAGQHLFLYALHSLNLLSMATGKVKTNRFTAIIYINRYRKTLVPKNYDIEFLPYDWTLNRQ